MIRMVFDPVLNMDEDKLMKLCAKLAPLHCSRVVQPTGRCLILVETMQNASNLAYTLPKIKYYVYCDGCNTLHFKTEFTYQDAFVCLCGKPLNKRK